MITRQVKALLSGREGFIFLSFFSRIDIQKTSPLMMKTRRTSIVTTAMKKLF